MELGIGLAGDLASITGLALALLQWMASARKSGDPLTAEGFLTHLSKSEQRLAEALQQNSAALADVARMIQEVRTSVVQEILDGNERSTERLREAIVDQLRLVDMPRLQLRVHRSPYEAVAGHNHVSFGIQIRVVNVSKGRATIRWGEAKLLDGDNQLRAYLVRGGPTELAPDRGSAVFHGETNSVGLAGRARQLPRLASVTLQVDQFEKMLEFTPGEGDTLLPAS